MIWHTLFRHPIFSLTTDNAISMRICIVENSAKLIFLVGLLMRQLNNLFTTWVHKTQFLFTLFASEFQRIIISKKAGKTGYVDLLNVYTIFSHTCRHYNISQSLHRRDEVSKQVNNWGNNQNSVYMFISLGAISPTATALRLVFGSCPWQVVFTCQLLDIVHLLSIRFDWD